MKAPEVADFNKEVIERSYVVPVLVDFWAEWCGPCKFLGPVLERLAEKNGGRYELVKVDTDAHQELAAQYGIRGIPNVKLFVDGTVVSEFTGALPEPMVAQWLASALPNRFRKEIEQAKMLMEEGNEEEAGILLKGVLAQEPANHDAQALIARTIVFSDPERAVELVRDVEENSGEFPLAEAIRTIGALARKSKNVDSLPDDPVRRIYLQGIDKLLRQDFDGALELFIGVVRENRMYDDDGARKACIAIFRILGDSNDIARTRRREFSSALNR